jgi:cell wall-associated NlpC family hydrolase
MSTRRFPDSVRTPALFISMGLLAILVGCSSAPSIHPAASSPTSQSTPPAVDSPHQHHRNNVTLMALSLLDAPYAWGGRGPATGFDCSGLVAHVYKQAAGLSIRGSSSDLGRKSRPIDSASMQPGDLVFFNTLGARHSHVGIYIGDQKFVHASNPRTGVRIDTLTSRYYAQRFEGAGSLLD